MKNLFANVVVAMFILTPGLSIARHGAHGTRANSHTDLDKHRAYIAAMIEKKQNARNSVNKAARTTTEYAERLIASSDYNITDTTGPIGMIDSGRYKYSASRSSTFNYDHMAFDTYYYLGTSFIMGMGGDLGRHDQNNAPSILFDSAWYIGSYFSSIYLIDTFGIYDTQYMLFDTAYNITEYADLREMDTSAAYDNNRYINTYDTGERITHSLTLSWSYGSWDSSESRTFFYDTLNFVIKDSSNISYAPGVWLPDSKWYYFFDDSGNMAHANYYFDSLGTWILSEQYFMHYNSANQMIWDSVCQYTGGAWIPQAVDTIGYTSGHVYRTYEKTLNAVGGTPSSYLIFTKHINGIGLPDTMYQEEYNYSDNTIIEKIKYSISVALL